MALDRNEEALRQHELTHETRHAVHSSTGHPSDPARVHPRLRRHWPLLKVTFRSLLVPNDFISNSSFFGDIALEFVPAHRADTPSGIASA